jgi:hypothetical protein
MIVIISVIYMNNEPASFQVRRILEIKTADVEILEIL